ncbi:Uncharacterized protein HZ326_18521 [Fusarium oxysporum f. sp. albedinis]|nr:Uncharacterized protein HZ326_18521 [Fusarium oxysporum f. sp. albedinis]
MRRPIQQVEIGLLLRLQTVDYGYYARTIRYNPRSQCAGSVINIFARPRLFALTTVRGVGLRAKASFCRSDIPLLLVNEHSHWLFSDACGFTGCLWTQPSVNGGRKRQPRTDKIAFLHWHESSKTMSQNEVYFRS